MERIDVVPATASQRTTLENLFQLYIHDFSEHWAGKPDGELADDGRFAPYPLDDYWSNASHIPLLIRCGEALIGFALLNAASHTDRPVDRNVAEFFIVRKHRSSGAGTQAAHTVFERYPGQWEAAVARRNVSALAFWRTTIRGCKRSTNIEELDVTSPHWNGPVIRFEISS